MRAPAPDAGNDFAPAPQLMPQREEDDATVQDTRRFMAQTYARFGLAGVLRLLPREATAQLAAGQGGGRRGRGTDMWAQVRTFVSCPEKMLFVLLFAFALLVVWDSLQSEHAANAAATLASLHMAPFPVSLAG